jgi:hypothetical protein
MYSKGNGEEILFLSNFSSVDNSKKRISLKIVQTQPEIVITGTINQQQSVIIFKF